MRVNFTCQTCENPVEYEFVGVETHRLRRYGVRHYVPVEPCPTCAALRRSAGLLVFDAAEESEHVSGGVPRVSEALLV